MSTTNDVIPYVLIADDQPDVLDALRLLLKPEGFAMETAASPEEILGILKERDVDVVLMDLNYARDTTSGREGLELLPRIQEMDPTLPVIVMTAWSSVDVAVEAMRRGARDYIEKPWDNNRLLTTLRTQIELGQALRRSRRLESETRMLREQELPTFIAEAASMKPVLSIMERVGPADANVLITGEHGTGKEVVARWLHSASARVNASLVTVNSGAVAEGVFESELFGHVKGAFTGADADRVGSFELADRGTLFLDEIANMPIAQQAKLLRVLETGEFQRVGSSKVRQVDVRCISATNADLGPGVRDGRFREDLLYRLNTVEINLPALRERREDIPVLAMHFLSGAAAKYHGAASQFTPAAIEALVNHPWPGNVRELEHTIERAALLTTGDAIDAGDLGLQIRHAAKDPFDEMTLDEVEQCLIERKLARVGGNVSQAAALLGVSRSALYRRLQRFGIEPAG